MFEKYKEISMTAPGSLEPAAIRFARKSSPGGQVFSSCYLMYLYPWDPRE